MISIEEARAHVLARAEPLGTERVGLDDAFGRVLSEPIVADRDFPPSDRSAMDGYAVRAGDVPEPDRRLRLVGTLRAGQPVADLAVGPGEAIGITTGSIVPPGADAVVMVELTGREGERDAVLVRERPEPGQHIRRRAEEARRGERLLEPGVRIGPAEIATLASVGAVSPSVYVKPVVHVVSTGDEVVAPGSTPAEHQIRNSNAPALLAALRSMDLAGVDLGVAADDEASLERAIARGLEGDVLLMTGGVSMGGHDLVGAALEKAGATTVFHKVAMKPGKPILFATCGRTRIFGLPGNPVSALAGFTVFVAPMLRGLSGCRVIEHPRLLATASEAFRPKRGRTTWHLARLETRDGELSVGPVRSRGSGDVISMARANAFAVTAADARRVEPGERVEVVTWDGWWERP